uniref:Ubiquitin carboxyl-terminal hydrolase MINDY n=1 Tax=Denticeps clupeoides TaxID=299321 RepID=A0AAY4BFC2_9TELE
CDTLTVEEISASLVREYLSRKGLKRTISCMDEELPRTNSSINNRSDLCRLLRLESLYKKNKAQDCPFKTLLEIIVKHHTEDVELSRSHSTDFQNSPVGHNLPKNDSGPGLGESSGNCALSRAVMTRYSSLIHSGAYFLIHLKFFFLFVLCHCVMFLCSSPDDVDEGDEIYSSSSPAINHHVPQYNFDARPIDLQTATVSVLLLKAWSSDLFDSVCSCWSTFHVLFQAVKEVIFGSPLSCFSEEWKCQNFSFSDEPDLRYGIVQKKGGPCGVLAAVQACVLQKLLFEGTGSDSALKLQPSDTQRTKCLALALAEILWRAGDRRRATVALTSKRHHFIPVGHYKSEGILEMVSTKFQSGPFGCIFLTISAILSRSIEMVRKDMDVYNTTLIGAHGYCTQELVNLLLCGRAVSNVFDDGIALDSGNGNFTLLKGIPSRSDIGLLSLYEHYNICKVGDHLKSPIFPIWVVCSESHFSVLFSCNKDLTSSHCKECTFDLYYYDGLANQQEQIRLTICNCQDSENDLVPPLEHCIRTRWRNAVVNWNENEPIL